MSKKTNETHTPFNKGMAKVLSATMAVASVVSVLPTNIANADVTSALDALNAAVTDAEMQAALTAPDLGLNLTGYNALSAGGQTTVAGELIAVRGAGFADPTAVQTALNSAVATQQNAEALTAAVAAVNGAADAAATRSALEAANLGLILTSYNALSGAGKDAVAASVLAARPGGGYADKAAIQTALNDAVTARADAESLTTAVANVNGAADGAAIRTALESPYLGLILTSYSALSDAGKNSVANAVLAARPGGGYGSQADIQSALNSAVTTAANEEALLNAVAAVNGAADAGTMRSALEAANLGLVLTTYNALSDAGKTNAANAVLVARGGGYADKAAIQSAFNAAVTTEFNAEASVTAIAAVNSAADAAAIRSALESATLGLVLNTYNTLSDAGKNLVAAEVLAARPGGGFTDKMSIQSVLNTAVSTQANAEAFQAAMAAVNGAPDASQMRGSLESATLGLVLTTYGNLSDGGKTNVAAAVLAARPGGGYADKTAIQNALNSAVTTEQNAEVIAAAVAAVNSAGDATSMQTALESATLGLILNSFNTLSVEGKTNVATAMLAVRPGGGFADKAAIQSALNSQVTAEANRQALAAPLAVVNVAGDATAMKSALEAPDLALDLTAYYQLNPTHKAAAAAAVLAARPIDGFVSQPVVQVALDAAVATETVAQAVEVVNNASDVASMKSALTATKLGLNLAVYNGLSNADKTAVASLVFAGLGGGFANQAAVQSALDNAIAINAPMATVNHASDATATQTALEDGALGLTLGVYATWTTADKVAVAESVRTARPADGYADTNAVQTAFDAAVTARTAEANVNIAADATSMQAALEDAPLALTLGAYSTWATADQAAVAADVLANRPAGGYADRAAIQAAFDAAVVSRTAMAAVNTAGDATSMQTALEDAALALVMGPYGTWTAADKVDVATVVLGARSTDGFVDLAELQTTFDAAVAMRMAMATVNTVTTAADMQLALEEPMIGLIFGAYATWSDADKAAVSAAVLASRPIGGYVDTVAVQTAFDTALAGVAPLANVNAAGSAGAMQAALEDAGLGLTLSADYMALSGADLSAVAQWVLNNRSAGGYVDAAAVQVALDVAVALQYVNIAGDATQMQAALASSVLALNFGVSSTWDTADKAAVAEYVRLNRGAGYLTQSDVQAALDAGVTARTAVADVNNAASDAAMQTALEAGALGLDLTVYNTYTAADKAVVAANVLAGRPVGGYDDLVAVQTAFDAVVAMRSFMAAVNTAVDTTEMEAALENAMLGLTLGVYAGWSTADQAAVVASVLAARPAGGYVDESAVQSAFDAGLAARTAMAAVNSAGTATAMQTALEDASLALTLGSYASYTDADKVAVATDVLAGRSADGYVDQAEVQTTFDAAVAMRSFMAAVNTAATTTDMQTALEDPMLMLILGAYSTYTNADKAAVVADVLNARPVGGYVDQAEVQTAFDAAVAMRSYMAAVNTAASATDMETALEDASLFLMLGAYAGWTAADQAAVAADVLATRPLDGYADQAAVQTAFDVAVATRAAVAAVNSAADAAAMQTALEDVTLNLSLGVYATWSTADKDAVATAVLASRPGAGYADQATVQSTFDAAVTTRASVAAVNSAADVVAMQTALEDATLGLTLSAYAVWSTADKVAVASDVLANRPGGGYADQATVQTAFDAALTARTAVAAVNGAGDVITLQTALENGALALDLTAYNPLSTADKTAVVQHVLDHKPVGGFVDVAAVQLALDSAITADAPMAAVNNAVDATTMETALENLALGLTLGDYNSWSQADQTAVAADVLAGRPGTGYADLNELQTTFDAAVAMRMSMAAVNSAGDVSSLEVALEDAMLGLTLGAFVGWSETDQAAVAADVLMARPLGGYADLTELQTTFDAAVAMRTAVAAVNSSADVTAMETALEDGTLGLTVGAYAGWSTADQAAVAAMVLAGRPAGGYADLASVQMAFDAAVAARAALAAVNTALDDASIQTALEDPTLGLVLGAYAGWSANDKAAVVATVFAGRPLTGYADMNELQTTFDAAVASRSAVAAVNSALDPAMIEVALEDPALNLTLGAYAGWSQADQTSVTWDVWMARPIGGFADLVAVQAAFDAAMAPRVAMAAVNSATDVAEMQTALENVALVLDLSVYNTLSEADRGLVSEVVLMVRPDFGFIDQGEVQMVLDDVLVIVSIDHDRAALELDYAAGDSAAQVTQNIILPTVGVGGSTITWTSDNSAVVAADGTVTRPTFADGDAVVVLTAVIEQNGFQRTKEFVVKVLKQAITDGEAVEFAANVLDLGYAMGDSASGVTQNLTLLAAGDHGTTITWSSDNGAVIAADGTVTRPANSVGDATVTLTATIEKNGTTTTKTFVTKVLKQAQTDAEAVSNAKTALDLGYTVGDTADSVTQDLTLASIGADGTTVMWSSDTPTVIAADGTVTRPAFSAGDAVVTLTATIIKNGAIDTKTFIVKVLKQAETDSEAVEFAVDVLDLGYAMGDSATGVTQNITLPFIGEHDTTVTWSIDNTAVITPNGAVNRPANSAGDQVVTLTATISKNGATATKTFVVKVLKQAQTDGEAVSNAKAALDLGYAIGDGAESVTQDLTLATTGADGTTITWSSDSYVIGADGTVTRPLYTSGDTIAVLTATITKNGATATKKFVVKVLKQATMSDGEAIEIAWHHLQIGYAQGETEYDVTQNLTLPTAGVEGTVITWESSNTAVIAHDGTVTRPEHTMGYVTVTLTATITRGGATTHKLINVTVLADAPIPVTPAPLATDIVVMNNPTGNSDTVTVNGLQTGDIVTIYAADGITELAQGTVLPGSVSAILQIAQLGTTNGTVKVTVTRPGFGESAPVSKVFAAENAKPYTIENGTLTRTSGIKATVTIKPTEGMVVSGNKYVVFELMNGTTPEGIIVLQYNSQTTEQLTAHFNKANNPNYKVKVFVVDGYGDSLGDVGNTLASPVTVQ